MTRKPCCEFLVASCVPNGGAYRYCLCENGEVELLHKISMPSPMYFALQQNKLWAVLRAPFKDSDESGIAAYQLSDGRRLTEIVSTKGTVACHIAVDGEDVYCANYISGSVFKKKGKIVTHTGKGTNPKRQDAPHAHAAIFSPDKKHLLVCDLGLDTIFVYDRDLTLISKARVPDGSGARHAVFSKDGKYLFCVNEMAATVSVFSYESGYLTYLHDVGLKPKWYIGQGQGAAIKLSSDGEKLYVTERGSETIAVFSVNKGEVTLIEHYSSHGAEPRDFTLLGTEKFAVCTNQFANCFSLYRVIEDGRLEFIRSVSVPAPLCAVEM